MRKLRKMGDLDIKVRELGIDPEIVDFEDVEAFMVSYNKKTGHNVSILETIELLYNPSYS